MNLNDINKSISPGSCQDGSERDNLQCEINKTKKNS